MCGDSRVTGRLVSLIRPPSMMRLAAALISVLLGLAFAAATQRYDSSRAVSGAHVYNYDLAS